MKVSLQWLKEWVELDLNPIAIANQLTMAGLEVEGIERPSAEFSGVVVAHVRSTKPHPDATKLNICEVDPGTGEILQIVCGAANVRAGLNVPLAMIGAKLGDLNIKKAKLRGELSQGMICSESELGLLEASDGIMELPVDAPVGMDFQEYLKLNDHLLDISLTPNRGDCLSVQGIARELSALTDKALCVPEITEAKSTISETLNIKRVDESVCPRYCGRIIANVNAAAPTPLWMKERLRRANIRSISIVVDTLNYVMLELGQPMHAFDFTKIKGDITVRFGRSEEKLTLLDNQEITLTEKVLVIADQEKALALAGVMGGLDSSVTEATKDVFLESAYFDAVTIAQAARHYGLHSDASHRFERGVDFNLPRKALERATQLILELAGGEAAPVIDSTSESNLPMLPEITLPLADLNKILNMDFEIKEAQAILQSLGMKVSLEGHHLVAKPPSYRFDIRIKEDLIEEIARVHGYDAIPVEPLVFAAAIRPGATLKINEDRIKALFSDRGYHEAITYSFISEKDQRLFSDIEQGDHLMRLINPISNEMAIMRTSLWPSLVSAVSYNLKRQQSRVRLFEIGRVYSKYDHKVSQQHKLAAVIVGDIAEEQWAESKRAVDFFDLKADVKALLALCLPNETVAFNAEQHHALHPGQSAAIIVNEKRIGYIGLLHPQVQQKTGVKASVYLFELDLEPLFKGKHTRYQPLSKFPSVKRDFAVLVDRSVPSANLLTLIREIAGNLLIDIRIFDLYSGQNISKDKKSIAISLTLQDRSDTLKDEVVNQLADKVITALSDHFGAKLRD